jgi:hypothetical protein
LSVIDTIGSEGTTPVGSEPPKTEATNPTPVVSDPPKTCHPQCRAFDLSEWGLGSDGKHWYVFQRIKGDWHSRGVLKGLRNGRQSMLLRLLLQGHGRLKQDTALQAEADAGTLADRQKRIDGITQAISRIRACVLKCCGYIHNASTPCKPDPFEWDEVNHSYHAKVCLGSAMKSDGGRADSKEKLQFQVIANPTHDA